MPGRGGQYRAAGGECGVTGRAASHALRKEQCHCWAQVAAPSLGGQHGPGPHSAFYPQYLRLPKYLVGQQALSLVLASRLKGQVPPTGAQSHQGRGCSHQEGVLFLFIIKLLGTLRCRSLLSFCLVPGRAGRREAIRGTQPSTGVTVKAARPSRGGKPRAVVKKMLSANPA